MIHIEGDPRSPINQGTLCPKGAATFGWMVNPNRLTSVKYRAPYSDHWEDKPLDWAMERIAQLVKRTRDETFVEQLPDGTIVNHTMAIAELGGKPWSERKRYTWWNAQAAWRQSLAGLCGEAATAIERAIREQPARLSEDVDEAERAVAHLRDELIDRLRNEPTPEKSARTRAALNSVNAALSLIVGVEYPAAGIQRTLLEQAGAALRDLLDSGQLGHE